MADENEIVLRNIGGKRAVKIISNDQGQVVMATEEDAPLQPTNPGGKVDETAIHKDEDAEVSSLDAKASPISTDVVLGEDSEDGFSKKKFAVGDLGGGGGGATTFDGLTDTPVNKDGSDGFLVKVNGVNLDFLDPATFALSGHDHSGVYSPVAHDHSGVYSPVAHTHTDFLAKVGGVMSGNIDFSDVQEGIRFWDLDAAYFKAFYFDDSFGMIVIGDDATGLGGPPQVWSKTPRFNVGFNGFGQSDFGMWMDDAGDFITVLSLVDLGPLNVGDTGLDINLQGSGTRPKFNAAEIALLSDVPAGDTYSAAQIPMYDLGSGKLSAAVLNGLTVYCGDAAAGDSARLSVRDFVASIKGGAASPTWSFNMNVNSEGWKTPNSEPSDVFHDFDADTYGAGGTVLVTIRVSDGTTIRDVDTYVIVQGIETPAGP